MFPGEPPKELQNTWAKAVKKAEDEANLAGEPFDRQAEQQRQKQSIWNTFQLSYSACYQALKKVYSKIGLVATKKTHAPRGSGAREANAGGCVPTLLPNFYSKVSLSLQWISTQPLVLSLALVMFVRHFLPLTKMAGLCHQMQGVTRRHCTQWRLGWYPARCFLPGRRPNVSCDRPCRACDGYLQSGAQPSQTPSEPH